MTPHHDHMGANAHYGRAFVKYAGNIHRPGDGMIPDIEDEHDGWWIYWMVPEGFLQYKEYKSKHIAGCGPGDKGAITIKLLMAAEESAYLSVACGLSVLEHVATHGTAALGKVPYVKPRTQPQIAALWYRWGKTQSGPPPEEMSEEECNARFAAGRKAQAEAEAEKARVKAEKKAEKAAEKKAEKAEKAAEKAAVHQAAREAAREARAAQKAQKAAARDAPRGEPQLDLTADEAREIAVREGLELVPAANKTGFSCVIPKRGKYQAEVSVRRSACVASSCPLASSPVPRKGPCMSRGTRPRPRRPRRRRRGTRRESNLPPIRQLRPQCARTSNSYLRPTRQGSAA